MSNIKEIILDNCNRAAEIFEMDDFFSSYVIMAVIMFSFSPVTIILNTVTIYLCWKEKRMKSISDILLCFLMTTDIIAGFVAMPSLAAENVLLAMKLESPCSVFLVGRMIRFFIVDITLVTSILIVLDRYCSIFQPYYHEVQKNKTGFIALIVLLSWCACAIICLLSVITPEYLPSVVFIATADICLVVLSISVHLKIFIHTRKIQRDIAIERGKFEGDKSKMKSCYRIQGARVTAVMVGGVILCYAPQLITASLKRSLLNSRSYLIAFYWTTALIQFNSIVNPLVYIWQMKWFRKAMWKRTSRTTNTTEAE